MLFKTLNYVLLVTCAIRIINLHHQRISTLNYWVQECMCIFDTVLQSSSKSQTSHPRESRLQVNPKISPEIDADDAA